MSKNNEVSIHSLIGTGYENAWYKNCPARYRVLAGARNTKKSYTFLGYEIIFKIFDNPYRNIIVIRNTLATNRDSTFSLLVKLINELKLDKFFKINNTDMRIMRKSTKQLIVFKGMDEPYKITSINPVVGKFSDVYVEEAFEIDDYDTWRIIDGSIRLSEYEQNYYKLNCQITFVLNTWNKNHWIYKHFFQNRLEDDYEYLLTHSYMDLYLPDLVIDYGRGLYLHKSTYTINEFRAKEYDVAMEELKKTSISIFQVEALGMWGAPNGATYTEFKDSLIIDSLSGISIGLIAVGIDTGFSNGEGKVNKTNRIRSATSMQLVGLTTDCTKLICIDEYFHTNENTPNRKTEIQIADEIISVLITWYNDTYKDIIGQQPLIVYIDNADIGFRQILEMKARDKFINYLIFKSSTKEKIQTRVDFINYLMAFKEFLIVKKCKNLIREIRNSMKGPKGEARENFDDHAINANEYGWYPLFTRLRRYKFFKAR